MDYRISILCENSVGPISGTLGEHGFAALIEPARGEPVLFDTGQGATLIHNAARMNKDLLSVGKVILSHGHYDHAGGLLPLLRMCGTKDVFAHPGVFMSRYRLKDTGECLSIGIPWERSALEGAGAVFHLAKEFRQVGPGMYLTGEVPRVTPYESGDQGLYGDCGGRGRDLAPDDQSLVLVTGRGLLVVLGCCHSGVVNTLKHVASQTGRKDIFALIGGTHLSFSGREQLEQTIIELKKWGIAKLAVSHCTGFQVSARLSREFPKGFQVANVGYSMEI